MSQLFGQRPATMRRRCRLQIEALEERTLLSTGIESINGTGNNLANPDLGSAGTDLIRIAAAAYADGISTPAGANRPGARAISNALSDQTDPSNPSQDLNTINQKSLSDLIYVFGQFLDHDLDLTLANSGKAFDINWDVPGSLDQQRRDIVALACIGTAQNISGPSQNCKYSEEGSGPTNPKS